MINQPSNAEPAPSRLRDLISSWPGRRSGICVALALTTLAFAATPAFAEKIYYPGVSFGGPGSGPGQFKEPVGVAVNDATGLEAGEGDVYVVDSGNDRVERFSSSGVYLGQFNGSGTYEVEGKEVKHGAAAPSGAFQEPEQIAVDNCTNQLLGTTCTTAEDPSVGDVYVTDKGHKVVDKFSATGEYLGQLTEMKVCRHRSAPCEVVAFLQLGGLAVDSAGNLWVEEAFPEYEPIENKHFLPFYMGEFSSSGIPERAVAGDNKEFGRGGMVVEPNGDFNVISFNGQFEHAEVQVFEVAGEAREQLSNGSIGLAHGTTALAIVPSTSSQLAGDVLADYGGSSLLYTPIVEHEQQPLETFPGETVPKGYEGLSESDGLAVNASATVYASEHAADRIEIFNYSPVPKVITEPSSGVSETALTMHGSVNPGGEAIEKCYFEYGIEAGNYTGGTVACKQTPGAVNESVPVEAELSELAPAEARSFRLVAVNKAGIAKVGHGVTITRPLITQASDSDVGSTAATLSAEVDPAGYETCYRIEYGATTAYGGSVEGECIGAGDEAVALSREVSGLEPDVVYHFRVVATNVLGAKAGEDVVARTFPAGEGELPDGRVYELVSASPLVQGSDDGNVYVPSPVLLQTGGNLDRYNGSSTHGIASELPAQAAPDGEAVTYAGDPPASGGGGREGFDAGNQYVARRAAGGGWTQVSLSPPGVENEYLAFSGDLSTGVLETGGSEQLASDAPESFPELYSRSSGGGPFEALFTAAPENRTPKDFGSVDGDDKLETTHPLRLAGGNGGTGAVPAFSHLLFEASAVLPSTPPAPEGGTGANNLYDSVGGRLYLVNVLPGGEARAGATLGIEEGRDESGTNGRDSANAVSADGSRIDWSTPEWVFEGGHYKERASALYVRENDTQPQSPVEEGRCTVPADACTVQVDLKEPGSSGQNGYGQFVGASSDGSRVFFTDESRLTTGSLAQPGAPDLYEYDLEAPEEERLTDLSVPPRAGAGANVQGVVGTSEDGSYVYFVADGCSPKARTPKGRYRSRGSRTCTCTTTAHNDVHRDARARGRELHAHHDGNTVPRRLAARSRAPHGGGQPGRSRGHVHVHAAADALRQRVRRDAGDGGVRVRGGNGPDRVRVVQSERRAAGDGRQIQWRTLRSLGLGFVPGAQWKSR